MAEETREQQLIRIASVFLRRATRDWNRTPDSYPTESEYEAWKEFIEIREEALRTNP